MSFAVSLVPSAPAPQAAPAAAVPDARAISAPPPTPPGDTIARPVAAPSPAPSSGARSPVDATPVVFAALAIGGLAAPVVAVEAVVGGEELAALGSGLARLAGNARRFAGAYAQTVHSGARALAQLRSAGPEELGTHLGRQTLTHIGDATRGAVAGVGFTGGAWAVSKLADAVSSALRGAAADGRSPH